jgi:hypothetical protein
LATASAPLVENGLASTTDEEIARAVMRPTAPTAFVPVRKGTASGISAPRMPVVEAKAETAPPMKQPEFAELALGVLRDLRPIFGTSGPVVVYPSSATGA